MRTKTNCFEPESFLKHKFVLDQNLGLTKLEFDTEDQVLYQLSLLSLNYYPGGVGGWVGGSNGNKANLSPAEAGAGLSLAISASLNNLFQIGCTIIFMSAKLGTKKMLLRKRLGPKQILGPKKIWTVGSEGVGEVRGVWGSGQLR